MFKISYDDANKQAEELLTDLDKVDAEWIKTWKTTQVSLATTLSYGGRNQLAAQLKKKREGYPSNTWGTFDRIKKLGGYVRKGEKGLLVVKHEIATKLAEVLNSKGELEQQLKRRPIFIGNHVYNLSQTTLEDHEVAQPTIEGVESYEDFDKLYEGPTIEYGPEPCYWPELDDIYLPYIENFQTSYEYRATRFHEKYHSTGHKTRLNRDGITGKHPFGSPGYAKEEIIVESANLFTHLMLGLEAPIKENTLAYMKGWKSASKKREGLTALEILSCFNKGQQAFNYRVKQPTSE